ncbi:MAG: gamma-glutamyltransferase [Planctomycetota bacterium]|nr:gamma-glutamyltransferase [Planctomycetota bacterium]
MAADHPAASEAGARILREGGNVVDAAVATSFALSVTRPASCGIGGGGFMVIWDAEQQRAVAIDYRERAPAMSSASEYGDAADAGKVEPVSVRGGLAVGVPGTVAGLCHAAEKYGTLPLAQLLQPAIDLCRNGVAIDQHDIEAQSSTLQKIRSHAGYEVRFAPLLKGYLNNGVKWKLGDRFHSPQLPVLELIAAHGASGYYEGAVAAAICSTVANESGKMQLLDLASYAPTERNVLQAGFHGQHLITMPPPSSGGIALLQTLQSLESWEKTRHVSLQSLGHNSPDYIHVVTEALKHAFADRAEFLGDTDFVEVPVAKLLSPEYAARIADHIDMQSTKPLKDYGRFFANDDSGTSHFSVVDEAGNAVACTETINLTFGSFVVVPEFGILLNNQMDDFAANPGKANAFGLIQGEANIIDPGKRPLSSMTPTIVVENGKATYACGASGGPRIITATLQNILNHTVFEMLVQQAVTAPRFHHQWSPDELLLEPALFQTASTPLQAKGHITKRTSSLAATQAASLQTSQLTGGSDPRKHGQPAGY